MKLHTLVSCLHDFPVVPKENPEITSIEADSRKVKEGSLFVCMKGYTVDSHDFLSKQRQRSGCYCCGKTN